MNKQYLNIGSRRELFVDEKLIDRFAGDTRLKLHRPRREEIAMTFDKPWEGNVSFYGAIIGTEEGYRMYYRGHHFMLTPSPLPGEDKELSIFTNEDYYKGQNTRFSTL